MRDELKILEALIFASTTPLSISDMMRVLPDQKTIVADIHELQTIYADHGVQLVEVDGSYQFQTIPDLRDKLPLQRTIPTKLSQPALETLTIIAYRQGLGRPVTRAEIEQIRGVSVATSIIETLLQANFIEAKGKLNQPGHPIIWGVTGHFLAHFQIQSLDQLPGVEELRQAGMLEDIRKNTVYHAESPEN
jgi:segregation and condensation protein B